MHERFVVISELAGRARAYKQLRAAGMSDDEAPRRGAHHLRILMARTVHDELHGRARHYGSVNTYVSRTRTSVQTVSIAVSPIRPNVSQ